MKGRAPDGRSPDGRGENLGLCGFEVLANEPLGFPGKDGRALDDRGLMLGLVVRSSVLENEPADFLGVDSRKSDRGVKLAPAGFLPYFAKALGFANFDRRSAEGRGENSGRFGFEVFANELFDLVEAAGCAPERRPKLGLASLESALTKELPGFADIAGRKSRRGVSLGAGLAPCFPNKLLPFENVEGR